MNEITAVSYELVYNESREAVRAHWHVPARAHGDHGTIRRYEQQAALYRPARQARRVL
jgi:hypothetical protein